MGKTPGKWIKNFLLGKKSSKSSPSKGREVLKSSNKAEQDVSSAKLSISDPTISSTSIVACDGKAGLENRVPSLSSQSNETVRLCAKEHGSGSGSTQTLVCSVSSEDTERLKLDQAATKAQAAFRGHVARREFRSQKCIVMLQAQIRGHLVRREAVSTFCCVEKIVKFQELVRGHKDGKVSKSLGGTKRASENAFVYKLRASSPIAVPLRLQYCSGESSSASLWLERWTKSRFWDPPSVPKKNSDSKPRKKNDSSRTAEPEQDRSKRGSRRLSGSNAENGSVGSALDSEKGKRNPKRVPISPVNTLQEHSPNEIEKARRGLRKSSDSIKVTTDRSPVENGKPKQRTKKTLGGAVDDSAEKSKDIPAASPKQSDLEKDVELVDSPVDNFRPMECVSKAEDIIELNEDCLSNDNQKPNERRASLPAKFDPPSLPPQENGTQNAPKLPSYMAPTESARAKLRAQGSPRFSRDVAEKNVLLRRHSLSSSTNSMLSTLSPRAHKLVQTTARGVARGDRSFSSSRDGGDKLIQAEWRR